jgi:hypothetical protein
LSGDDHQRNRNNGQDGFCVAINHQLLPLKGPLGKQTRTCESTRLYAARRFMGTLTGHLFSSALKLHDYFSRRRKHFTVEYEN